jgi:predicted glycosyltransferase involved in capsule biosynthesis
LITRNEILGLFPDRQFIFADGYDDCIIGFTWTEDNKNIRLMYSATKIIDKLAEEMDYEDAEDFFAFNITGSYLGELTPEYVWVEDHEDCLE